MILIDTNIISTFAKIERLRLLVRLFGKRELYLSTNVLTEVMNAKVLGFDFVDKILDMVEGKELGVVSPDWKEIIYMLRLPNSLGSGERDSIAICKHRGGVLLSNDIKVTNFCGRNNIGYIDLNGVLRALWSYDVLTKDEVRELIEIMEEKDNLTVVSKDGIFLDDE